MKLTKTTSPNKKTQQAYFNNERGICQMVKSDNGEVEMYGTPDVIMADIATAIYVLKGHFLENGFHEDFVHNTLKDVIMVALKDEDELDMEINSFYEKKATDKLVRHMFGGANSENC